MTAEEFLAFEGEPDVRSELVDGEVRALAPPSDVHGLMVMNVGHVLRQRRAREPRCRPRADAGIRVAEADYDTADVAVSCVEATAERELRDPVLIVEVLSPSTRAQDLGVKLPAYRELPSLRKIWLVDSTRRWVEVGTREGEGWQGRDVIGSGRFHSPARDADIPLEELCEGVGV